MSKNLKEKLAAYGMVLPAFLVVMLTVAYPVPYTHLTLPTIYPC